MLLLPKKQQPICPNTGKLALPSISQVQPRGFEDQAWYQPTSSLQTTTAERLPALSQIQPHNSYSSVGSSPRGGSIGSAEVQGSSGTVTSYSSSVNGNYLSGLKTPSPEHHPQSFRKDSVQSGLHHPSQSLPAVPYTTFDQSSGTYISMNQPPSYIDVSQSHMPNIPSSAPPPGLAHYPIYQTTQPMQGGPHPYGSSPTSYSQYAYSNGLAPLHTGSHPSTASVGSQLVPQTHSLPTLANSVPPPSTGQQYPSPNFDTTGQVAPPGMKPRVTATLWEDEGSLCFQVEANGVCVARREGMCLFCNAYTLIAADSFLSRQSHDQRHQASQCCWHDQRPQRWHSEEREDQTCCQDWAHAPQRCMDPL